MYSESRPPIGQIRKTHTDGSPSANVAQIARPTCTMRRDAATNQCHGMLKPQEIEAEIEAEIEVEIESPASRR